MGDTMTLSVGGILSVGGWSNRSHQFGAVVDTVRELDVVTGDGRLMTCSPTQHEDLFNLSLAGMGQYAIIVRARVQLVAAPSHILQQDLVYDDLETYLSDAKRLILDARFHHLGSTVVQTPDGRWTFQINIGQFYDAPKEPNLTALEEGLKFNSKSEPVRVSYGDYLHRNVARLAAAAKAPPTRSASIAMFIPVSKAADFLAKILATPTEVAGMWSLAFLPLNARKFARPLFKLPTEDVALSLWLFRASPVNDTTVHAALMEANGRILERMRAMGGKVYPPYAPPFSQADWEDHYGRETWTRLTAAKRKFDPNHVLTPGPGIFSA
jgi:FAD/FMN-containing dehydrogenase